VLGQQHRGRQAHQAASHDEDRNFQIRHARPEPLWPVPLFAAATS
jgi:hypothetical protein